MVNRFRVGGVSRIAVAALALSLIGVPAAFAKNDNGKNGRDDDHRSIPNCNHDRHDDGDDDGDRDGGDHLFCPNKQVLVRIDDKICPDKPGRPAVVRKRVCCRHGSLTNCHPFRPCPPRSRS